MKYNTELAYEISYYDPKADDMIQSHSDSLATAVIALITRSRRYPDRRIDLTPSGNDKCLGTYEHGEYSWHQELNNPDWQKYIQHKLNRLKEARE
jgi:hypothetical protein